MGHNGMQRAVRRAVAVVVVAAFLAGCASHSTRHLQAQASDTALPGIASGTATPPATEPVPGTDQAPTTTAPAGQPGGQGGGAPSDADAAAMLATLPVGALNLAVPYDRTQDFGPAWADVDHNGCDTRNDILHRDLTGIEVRPGTHDCVVVAGTLADPYSGTTIAFLKAQADKVQIDHVVPLHAAWELGAYQWSYTERLAFANDPANLLAVDAHNNEVKGDSLADTWVPPNQAEWCDYASRTVAVHAAYHLPVTANEKDALGRLLGTCAGGAPPAPAPTPQPAPAPAPQPAPTPAPAPQPAPAGGGDVYYPNCAAVRAAGKAPLYRGEPGYRPALDRDGDGVACE